MDRSAGNRLVGMVIGLVLGLALGLTIGWIYFSPPAVHSW